VNKLSFWLRAGTLVACSLCASLALAQAYPTKPVRIVVPFAAGGSVDTLARLLGGKMSDAMGQPFLIDNRPGADGTIGANLVARSSPDGYTMLLIPTNLAIYPALYRNLPFDASRDFAPVTKLVVTHTVLVANPKLAASTVPELIKLARARPDTLNYGGSGPASILQMTMALFLSAAGLDIRAIPYKGDGPVTTALIAGEVDLAVLPFSSAVPHLKPGRLKVLGLTSLKRSSLLPDVPTIAEGGVPGFDSGSWQGLFVAAKTPAEIIRKLHQEAAAALMLPELRGKLAAGQETSGTPPEEFEAEFRAAIAKFTKLARDAKIPAQD
jgi:tripartite-type tricarboxylate transporter receptor subunit TctC